MLFVLAVSVHRLSLQHTVSVAMGVLNRVHLKLVSVCSDKLGLSLELGLFVARVMISTTDLSQHSLEQASLQHYLVNIICLLHISKYTFSHHFASDFWPHSFAGWSSTGGAADLPKNARFGGVCFQGLWEQVLLDSFLLLELHLLRYLSAPELLQVSNSTWSL